MEQGRSLHEGVAFSPDGRWLSTGTALYPIDLGAVGNSLPQEGFSMFDPARSRPMGGWWQRSATATKTENTWRAGVFEVATG